MSQESIVDEEQSPQGPMGSIRSFISGWGPAIFAVLFIRTFVFEPFRIPSGSMVPTLLIGDHVAVSKFSYGIWVPLTVVEIPFLDSLWVVPRYQVMSFAEPKRGDIAVFRYPQQESVNYIKRIVGVPGDRIKVEGNRIYINGVQQSYDFIDKYGFENARCTTTSMKRFVEDLDGVKHEVLMAPRMGGMLANMKEQVIPADRYFAMGDNRDHSEDSRAWGFVRPDQIKGKAHLVWLSWDGCNNGIRNERFFQSLYQ